MKKGFSIAIDGPAASGKGTIVQMLTKSLGGINIYTGGMYRALGLKVLKSNLSFDDEEKIADLLKKTKIDIGQINNLSNVAKIYLDGVEVTEDIKMPEVGIAAGKVALFKDVRVEMAKKQFEIADSLVKNGKLVVLDGQDAAQIYPNAKFKIFLTASQEVRARRRYNQYEKFNVNKNFNEVLLEIKDRDARDFSRNLRPLSKDPKKDGYFLLDSTLMNENETFQVIIEELNKRKLIND